MTKYTQQHREIAIGTPLGDDVLMFRSMSGTESLGRLFQFELELVSEDTRIRFEDIIGQNITVRMELTSGSTRYWNGYVSRFVQLPSEGTFARYKLTMVPWLWFLTRAADCRIFQDKTVPEIIKEIFNDHGFTDLDDRLHNSYRKWVYNVQYRETDFNFVSRLMEQEGVYYYFQHEDGKHKLVLCDDRSAHKKGDNCSELPYMPPDEQVGRPEAVTEWTIQQQVQPGKFVHTDYNFEKPKTDLKAVAEVSPGHAMSEYEVFDYPGEYSDTDEGDQYAKTRIEELHAQQALNFGQTDARGLEVGTSFELVEFPRPDQNGEYLVVSTNYQLSMDDFDSSGDAGVLCHCTFTAMEANRPYRSSRITPKPMIQGPQTAVVVGPSGKEIYTDKYGRIKVKFHWDRYSKADEKSSCWIRVAQYWSGKQWGALYTPRIGQEVIVEFLEGDPDRPLITGSVYNDTHQPPYEPQKHPTISTLKSLSSKGGNGFNEIRFEDKKDKEQIFVHAQRRMDVRIRDNYYETNYGNREVRVGWQKAGQKGGDFNTLVHRDVNYHVQGGEFRHIEKQLNQTVEGDVIEDHQSNHTTVVADTSSLNATKYIVETSEQISEKSAKITIQGSKELHAKGGKAHLEGGQELNLKGAKVCVEGSTQLSLKVGGSFVDIGPAGVSISGAMVNINSGGSASSAAAAADAESFEKTELELPFNAKQADNADPGAKDQAKGKPRERTKAQPTVQQAPPYVPPPPVPLSDDVPFCPPCPVMPVSSKPCGISDIEVLCQHRREPGPHRLLQVVPDAPITDQIKYKFAGFIGASLKRSYGGGEDRIKAKVVSRDGKSGGKKEAQITTKQAPPQSGWKSGQQHQFPVKTPNNSEIWPINAKPLVRYVHGRGCDDCAHNYKIESYPSQQYEATIELEFFRKKAKTIDDFIDDLLKALNATGAIKVKRDVHYPAGSLTAKWGWKEDQNWEAYFDVEVLAQLKPIIGAQVEFQASLLVVGAGLLGIPPWAARVIADQLADVFLFLTLSVDLSARGGPRAQFYASGREKLSGKVGLELEGGVEVGLAARVGSDYVLSVEVRGSCKTGFGLEGDFILKREGLFFGPAIGHKGLTLRCTVVTKAFSVEMDRGESEWEILKGEQIWPDKADKNWPAKIFPD